MKIAQIITRSDTIGGAHVHVKDLSRALMDKGHDVVVLVGQAGPFTELLRSAGVPYRSLRYLKRPISPLDDCRAVFELRKELLVYQPDVVACHSSKAGWLGRIAAKISGFPVVFTAHGWAFTEGVSPIRAVFYCMAERLIAPLTCRIITVSNYDRELAIKRRILNFEKIELVWNGIPDVMSEFGNDRSLSPPKVIMVARLDVPKNHNDLLLALSGLLHLSWSLDLVGDGPLETEIRKQVASLGLSKRVNFLGLRNDIPTLMDEAHIFALLTDWEGLPLSILEAMRAGLPVVASDVGGVKEPVKDHVTGFLIPRGDIELLRDCLSTLLQDNELRFRMGDSGRKRYETYFTLEQMVDQTLEVYLDTIKVKL